MDSLNWYWSYSQTAEHAAVRPVSRPDLTDRITVTNGKIYLASGRRLRLFGSSVQEATALWSNDTELRSTLKRIVAQGFNALRVRSIFGKKWLETAGNWGVWKYTSSDGQWSTLSNRWLLEETALVQLDKIIAWAFDYGLECVYLDVTFDRGALCRYPSNRAQGSYNGHGMMWSDEVRTIAKEHLARVLARTSTVTGVRHCDHPRLIWVFNNEEGFSDAYLNHGTTTWGGGSAVRWFDKLVDNIDDVTPVVPGFGVANGYWYTELNAKLTAWKNANYPSWTIPAWGRGSTGVADGAVGFPKYSVYSAWATGADPTGDKQKLLSFIADMDYEAAVDMIGWARSYNSTMVINPGTFAYEDPRTILGLPADIQTNIVSETHNYFYDNTGAGAKSGSAVTRKSVMDSSWANVTNGMWILHMSGVRASYTAFFAGECGQYSPNRWRYQRLYYEALLALLHGYEVFPFAHAQQYTTAQAVTDGRYMTSDHVNIGSPCDTLCARAWSPALIYGFLSEYSSAFTIYQTAATLRAKQLELGSVGVMGGRWNASGWSSDGSEHAGWGGKKIFFDIDEGATPTVEADFSAAPKVTDATRLAGHYVVNTATEKLWMRTGNPAVGYELMTPYMAGMVDTITATPTISANPVRAASLSAAVSCGLIFLRSDGLWPLFTGPMHLFIHGSDYDTTLVTQGGGPGEATFKTSDAVTVNYASGQVWLNSGTTGTTRLMMPEPFTVQLDTTNNGQNPAGTDLVIYGVTQAGVPVLLPSSYNSATKIWSFSYTGAYPEYTLQPKVGLSVRPLRRVR